MAAFASPDPSLLPRSAAGSIFPPPGQAAADARFMALALHLAARGLGQVAPNPAVGCVLVQPAGERGEEPAAGTVVGRGWTQPGGRPHAETEALAQAGAAAAGATAYVSLEPCAHHGRTPPCCEALAAAGVARVVVACQDPDSRVAGRGVAFLRQAGIAVTLGVGKVEALALNEGFFHRILENRPLFSLKLATTLDGRIATHSGHSHWITGPLARQQGHTLRACHDAVLVGIGTALADDPDLTCRLPGLSARSPVRVVLDSRLRLPLTARLVQTAAAFPTWIYTRPDADSLRWRVLEECGATVIGVLPDASGNPAPRAVAADLAHRGMTRVLVEGGAHLAASLIRADLVDRLEWFRAATLVGGDGIPALMPFGVDRVDMAPRFHRLSVHRCGDDLWERFGRAPKAGTASPPAQPPRSGSD